MASYGEGSIYATSDGRYRGALMLSTGKRHYVSGRTKTEVREKLRQARRRDEDGLPIGDQKTTVGEYLERWLTEVAPARSRVKSTNTLDQYAWAIRITSCRRLDG